ncbi:glycosyltransferase family 4 protein [Moritella viscosa]|uniref:Glycosyl transferase, group 1 n=1 Tax=Moritella viscosa TaxID=80854 RepID=A0ABY1HA21_9GAMM|nr:glycosyltransferase family 4 protein [Moritella viscosa]CED59928.1 glycosyl transferase, group 1 [Moritella viscosa]SGY87568.1 Glycosyl transferase, group 1 [Moritella viscosa]SGY90703.1 Glycosyl transferase, group 1 [Moritella viscosa]SGY90738.1 Glycosyl transferase, group 1 [Moritella viscosa]SGY93996.1 Glycosyl transferase, group 1 [Moritella viscosa]
MALLKLAFVTQFPADTNRPFGGVEAVSVNLVHALSAFSDLDIQVVTLCAKTKKITKNNWGKVTIHRLPRPKGSELINAVTKSKVLIADYVNTLGPDLIHAHDTYGIMINELPMPKVFTVHGFIYADTLLANGRFKRLRSKLWEYIEKGSWAKQPNIISISPYVRERVSSVSSAMVYDIDNPISDKFFALVRSEKVGTIFTSAVICSRKNTLQLVKAVGLLVGAGYNVQLRIAGSVGNSLYAKEQQKWILDNNLTEHVHLLGRISTEEVMKELSRASIYALTSLEENSPMGIEEAMAAGVPVVTSNRCGMPYMVKNGETGYLVNPFNEQHIADKLREILDSKELQLAMAAKSKELALDLYHSDNVARRTHAVYRDILTNVLPFD